MLWSRDVVMCGAEISGRDVYRERGRISSIQVRKVVEQSSSTHRQSHTHTHAIQLLLLLLLLMLLLWCRHTDKTSPLTSPTSLASRTVSSTRQPFNFGIASLGMAFVVLESVEIFVAFPTGLALIWFVFLHAFGAGIGFEGFGVDDAEGAVCVGVEGLGVMTVLDMIVRMESRVRGRGKGNGSQICGISAHFDFCRLSHSR